MRISSYLRRNLLNHYLCGVPFTPPATKAICLHVGPPGVNGTANPASVEQRRVWTSTGFSTWASYSVTGGGSENISHFSMWDSATAGAGNFLISGNVTATLGGTRNYFGGARVAGTTFTSPAHGMSVGTLIELFPVEGLSLPTGLTDNASYYVSSVTANTFTLTVGKVAGGASVSATGDCYFRSFQNVAVANAETVRLPTGALNFGTFWKPWARTHWTSTDLCSSSGMNISPPMHYTFLDGTSPETPNLAAAPYCLTPSFEGNLDLDEYNTTFRVPISFTALPAGSTLNYVQNSNNLSWTLPTSYTFYWQPPFVCTHIALYDSNDVWGFHGNVALIPLSTSTPLIATSPSGTAIFTTSVNHGLSNNDYIYLGDVAGYQGSFLEGNVSRQVSNVTSSTFQLSALDGGQDLTSYDISIVFRKQVVKLLRPGDTLTVSAGSLTEYLY